MKRLENILYLSEPATEQASALARAVSLAENNQAALTVMDVVAELLRERLGADSYGYLDPKYHSPQGNASRLIPQVARRLGADLVVMGTVGRRGIPGLFIGNTAEAVLEQFQCAVLALEPRGFVSPVLMRV